MSSELSFVEFIVDQLENVGKIRYRKMFGEYALYSDDLVVALICDDKLFVKQTEAGRDFIDDVVESSPYPGAKPYFHIEDQLENREWLSSLVRITAKEISELKPKPKKKKKLS